MLTVENLKELGVNTDEGLARCMNNEQFYLMLVGKALSDDGIERLDSALRSGNLDEGFETAHSLKGVLGNLSLTPLYDAVAEITELLRARTQIDYTPYMEKITSLWKELKNLCD